MVLKLCTAIRSKIIADLENEYQLLPSKLCEFTTNLEGFALIVVQRNLASNAVKKLVLNRFVCNLTSSFL